MEDKLTPEIKAELDPLINADIEEITNWSPETKARAAEFDRLRMKSPGKERARDEFKDIFFASDQNADQLLNLAEFLDAGEKLRRAKEERNEPDPQRTEDQSVAYYAAINKITPEVDGVSDHFKDLMKMCL